MLLKGLTIFSTLDEFARDSKRVLNSLLQKAKSFERSRVYYFFESEVRDGCERHS